ncbi:MAG: six-hairpin glycosidase [Ignavibacteria bacterium RBG_13_36_8]|nr:MAG: six-hairpin glycosidase [Ignavibacteria bacterium RBG_13_36_8]
MLITKKFLTVVCLCLLSSSIILKAQKIEKDYPITPVSFTQVKINDTFWRERMDTNCLVTIPFAFRMCEETGRISNFEIAGDLKEGEHKGDYPFDDTDPYKVLEGASYSLAVEYDPQLDQYLDELISKISAAQEDDGYLYTCRTNKCTRLLRWMGNERWEKLNSHELYNMGHLYEAAYAHYQATGKKNLLDVALKNAELINKVFGPAPNQKHCPSGHQIIEMGLVKLYRLTGDEKYLNLAKFFLDETGYGHDGHKLSEYSQDHKPIIEQDEAVGHAVRAGYMYSGIADVAALTGNKDYINAIDRIWNNVVSKKLYITGGIGARSMGEGFGENYELPNMTAYCETCASIANVYWNHRLFLLHGEAKYIDVMERTLYNSLLSGVSLSGNRFFYDNILESDGTYERLPWFGCACCPGNITRFLSSFPGYVYAVKDNDIFVNLFVSGTGNINLGNNKIELTQETDYPWDGKITITVLPENKSTFSVLVRIPGWAQNIPVPSDLYKFLYDIDEKVTPLVNGKEINFEIINGYAVINRKWKDGDRIELNLSLPVRRILSNENVECNQNKITLQRGPIVYCLEGKDQPGKTSLNLFIEDSTPITVEFKKDFLGGVTVLKGKSSAVIGEENSDLEEVVEQEFTAIPYSVWNNRGKDEMAVWIPRDLSNTYPRLQPTIASTSTATASVDYPVGLNDQFDPQSSHDISYPFFYWWLKRGTEEWVQYDFEKPETVSSVEVYWLELDHYDGKHRVPESWQLLYKNGDEWKPIENLTPFTTEKDKYNIVSFKPVTVQAIRLTAKLQTDASAGIIEWKVN